MHLIDTKNLTPFQIQQLFESTHQFKKNPWQTQLLAHKTVALLFFENSTRTRCSFELAAKRLGATIVNLNSEASSTQKGESLLDTIWTLEAMQVDAFIIRHQDNNICQFVAENLKTGATVLNAGNGTLSHPTQALLDAFTIQEFKPDFEKLSIAIVGDIRHSRVAHSNILLLQTLGVNDIRLVGPEDFLPDEKLGCQTFTDLNSGIENVDVIMMLRIQKERMIQTEIPNSEVYFKQYGLTEERLKLTKSDVLVMHPGPLNRNIEIEAKVADGKNSVILRQVQNGMFIRQALLAWLLN